MIPVLTWTSASGMALDLIESNGVIVLLDGIMGLDAPVTVNTISPYIGRDGGALINRRRDVRSIVLPLYVEDPVRVQTTIGNLVAAFQGPGMLTHSDTLRTRTLRNVIYDAGMSGNWSMQTAADLATWRLTPVNLIALDPWWYGSPTEQALSTSAATPFSDAGTAFSATLPFDGGNAIGVTNAGDADAFPVVTLTGPLSTFAVTLGVAGTVGWSIATPLVAGDVLVVDSRPGSRGPRLNGGAVDWSLLTESSRLFVIPSGTTSVISSATGTSGATSASVSFDQRYLTP